MTPPAPQPCCPECGKTAGDVVQPWPIRLSVIRLAQGAVLLLIVWWCLLRPEAWITNGAGNLWRFGFNGEWPRTQVRRRDIVEIASGSREPSVLRDILRGSYDVTPEFGQQLCLHAAFGPGIGDRTDLLRIGWPCDWAVFRRDLSDTDVYAAAPLQLRFCAPPHATPRTPRGWFTLSYINRWKLPSGERGAFVLNLRQLGTSLVLIPMMVIPVRLAVAGIRRLRRAVKPARVWRPWVIAASIWLILALIPHRDSPGMYSLSRSVSFTRLGVMWDAVIEARSDEDVRHLAEAIARLPGADEDSLTFAWVAPELRGQQFVQAPSNLLGIAASRIEFLTDPPLRVTTPAVWIAFNGLAAQVRLPANEGAAGIQVYQFNIPGVIHACFYLWLAWTAVFLLLRAPWAWARWRIGRRIRRGECAACGYDLSGLATGSESAKENRRAP